MKHPSHSFRNIALLFAASGISILAVATLVFYAGAATTPAPPVITVTVSTTTPAITSLKLGVTNQTVLSFTLTGDPKVDTKVNDITVDFFIKKLDKISHLGIVRQFMLYEGDKVKSKGVIYALSSGDAVKKVGIAENGYAHFYNLGFVIPKGTSRTLTLKGTLSASAGNSFSGVQIRPRLVNGYSTDNLPAIVTAATPSSTAAIVKGDFSATSPTVTLTGYESMVYAFAAADSPSGLGVQGYGQPIARFILSSDMNPGGAPNSIVSGLTFSVNSTFVPIGKNSVLSVYKGLVASSANLLGTIPFVAGMKSGTVTFVKPVYIDFATNQSFTVTADTVGAKMGSTISIGLTGINWSDGVSQSIPFAVGLPLAGKSITF